MTSSKPAGHREGDRNPGSALRLDWLEGLGIEPASAERRSEEITRRARVDPRQEFERLLDAIRVLDLTTLSDDDTDDDVRALCALARRPIPATTLVALGRPDEVVEVAAVCVYDRFVPVAREALAGTRIRIAAVTGGFPRPLPVAASRLAEIQSTVLAGTDEIDVVITREHAQRGSWSALYDEVRALRSACGEASLKTILATGDLNRLETIARASLVCCMGGADFVKTSTGREAVNATLPAGLAVTSAIRRYQAETGHAVGLKPAGGIRTPGDALPWLQLAREELGDAWTRPDRLRIGASSLLATIVSRLSGLAGAAG